MPATDFESFGEGVYGIAADETGCILSNISYAYVNDKVEHKNRVGNITGMTYKNERCEIEFSGTIPATAAFSGKLASTLVLHNAVPNHLASGVTGAILVEDVSIEKESETYNTMTVKATLYPHVSVV